MILNKTSRKRLKKKIMSRLNYFLEELQMGGGKKIKPVVYNILERHLLKVLKSHRMLIETQKPLNEDYKCALSSSGVIVAQEEATSQTLEHDINKHYEEESEDWWEVYRSYKYETTDNLGDLFRVEAQVINKQHAALHDLQKAGVNSPKSTLYHWINNSSKKLLLDFRPLHKHYTRRIIPSVCIPFTDLKKHLFELPSKSLPFAVLEPHDNAGITQKLLIDQGWNVPWIFVEGEELWEVSRELGILEEIDDGPNNEFKNRLKWTLFQPSPFLVRTIDRIEESLKHLSSNHVVNCLDIACGNGRDAAWLSSRQTIDWRVTAVDAMSVALDRTRQLASDLDVLFKIQTFHAKIMVDGSVKRYQESLSSQTSMKDGDGASEMIKTRPKFDNIPEKEIEFLNKEYDLVISIRFLRREFLSNMASLVKPRGFLLISTFVNDGRHTYKNPRSNSHRLELGELATKFRKGFEIINDEIELIEDGRPVNSFLARKKI
ncbi:hypothetical protein RhiirC2_871010 [Rhizophagus irregularis]|uniref:S-adenosyl-L-methionine-dependent methyltransferase n=1 Tax=Rhizophagus irregularis TaxID=588596 RepID=A0A2N1MF09_9GLOM|nr:hypothetical protein RhiirC2_871010 [Rhizophagus irregularis]